jgi:hypothetical protein
MTERSPRAAVVPLETTPPEDDAAQLIAQYGRTEGKRLVREREALVSVFVMPSDEDVAWSQNHTPPGEASRFPIVPVTLDGTRYDIQVGETNTVPRSVWDAYTHTKRLPIVNVPGVFQRALGEDTPELR